MPFEHFQTPDWAGGKKEKLCLEKKAGNCRADQLKTILFLKIKTGEQPLLK